ncbi:hypothetical protein [Larkinella rosea]|nr:hypothetical protein [Larkinella rosea]
MADNKDINLPNHTVIEARWLSMVNEIQQQHNVLIDLIEKLEQNPATDQRTIYQLTVLQQHVLDTLNHLLAESLADSEPVAPSQLSERFKKKHTHSQVLVQLKKEIDRELASLTT